MFWLCCKKAQLTVKVVDLSIMDTMDTMDTCGPTIDTNFRFTTHFEQTRTFHKSYPTNVYLFKVNNRNTRKWCEICPKFTIKTPDNVIDVVTIARGNNLHSRFPSTLAFVSIFVR